MRLWSALFATLVVSAIPLGPASGADATKARQKIEKEDIPFTAEKFLLYVFMGDNKMVSLFVEAGIPLDSRDQNGWTALHVAARHDDPKILLLLIKAGADVNARDPKARRPCRAAARGSFERHRPAAGQGDQPVCDFGKAAPKAADEQPSDRVGTAGGQAVRLRDNGRPPCTSHRQGRHDVLRASPLG
jgi:hypothetical protein